MKKIQKYWVKNKLYNSQRTAVNKDEIQNENTEFLPAEIKELKIIANTENTKKMWTTVSRLIRKQR